MPTLFTSGVDHGDVRPVVMDVSVGDYAEPVRQLQTKHHVEGTAFLMHSGCRRYPFPLYLLSQVSGPSNAVQVVNHFSYGTPSTNTRARWLSMGGQSLLQWYRPCVIASFVVMITSSVRFLTAPPAHQSTCSLAWLSPQIGGLRAPTVRAIVLPTHRALALDIPLAPFLWRVGQRQLEFDTRALSCTFLPEVHPDGELRSPIIRACDET